VDGIVRLLAHIGSAGDAGDGGPATAAALSASTAVVVDAAGQMFVADRDNGRIRRITVDGTITAHSAAAPGQSQSPSLAPAVRAACSPAS
jgi:hypothetical protein